MYFSIYAIVTILTPLSLYIISGKTAHRALKASIWVVSYNIILGIMSYYGSLGINYIIYPYDYIIFAILSLAIYFVATNTGYHTQKLKDYQAANGATDE